MHRSIKSQWSALTLIVLALALGACSGGSNVTTSDTPAPGTVPGGILAASLGSPSLQIANVINAQSAATGIMIELELDPSTPEGSLVQLTLRDGFGGSVSAQTAAPAGGGLITLGPVDVSGLADGPIKLFVHIVGGIAPPVLFGPFPKDTTAPPPIDAPLFQGDVAFPDVVNLGNVTNAVFAVSGPEPFEPDQIFQIVVSDGIDSVVGPLVNPSSLSGFDYPPLDLSPLGDGMLDVILTSVDPVANGASQQGDPLLKDTSIGSALAVIVAAGMTNPQGMVNRDSEASTLVQVTFPSEAAADELVTLTIGDGTTQVTIAMQPTLVGGGIMDFTNLDLSSLADGPLTLSAAASDAHGNVVAMPGAAVKDTAIGAVTSVAVAASAANPSGFVNAGSQGTVVLDVDLANGVKAGDDLMLRVLDGASGQVTASFVAIEGPVVQSVGPLDVSGLADGALTLEAWVTDVAGNSTTLTSGGAQKDTAAPSDPGSPAVAAGPNNPSGFVNAASVTSVQIEVTPGAGTAVDATVELTVTDGTSTVSAQGLAASPVVVFSGLDLSALADGALALGVIVTDAAGNATNNVSGSATLDRVVTAPSGANVAAGPSNAIGIVNVASVGATFVELALPGGTDANDQITLTLGVSASSITLSPQAAGGPGFLTLGPIDVSTLPDGSGSLTGTATDAAGNLMSFGPFGLVKDTTPPVAPTAFSIPGGLSAPNQINQASATAVPLQVTWPAGADPSDVVSLMLADSFSASVSAGPIAPPSTAGTVGYGPVDASSLADGAIALTVQIVDPAGNTTNLTGTSATKDTVAPAAVSAISLPATMSSPAGFINATSASAVAIDLDYGTLSDAADTTAVTLLDGATSQAIAPFSSPMGMTTVNLTGIDTAGLQDGPITISVAISDAAQNTTTTILMVTRDTVPPQAPNAANVAMGPNNGTDFVTAASAAAVVVSVDLPSLYDGTESVSVELRDFSTGPPVIGASMPVPSGGGIITLNGLDLTLLADGAISLDVLAQDAAGNTATYSGAPATKDTSPPPAPSALGIASGPRNAPDLVNTNNVAMVALNVTWDMATVGDESAMIDFSSSGGGLVTFGPITPPSGGGIANIPGIDLTPLADGTVSILMTLTDPVGNATPFSGSNAILDVTPPATPLSGGVLAGGGNPANAINSSSVAAVVIEAMLGAGSDPADTVFASLSDGTTGVGTMAVPGTTGAGTITFSSIDASALADGMVTLTISVVDQHQNTVAFPGAPVTKAVVPPAVGTAQVAMTMLNPAGYINMNTESAVSVEVTVPSSYVGSEMITVTLGDGVAAPSTSSPVAAPAGGGTVIVTGLVATGFGQGPITVMVDVMDAAGNMASFAGSQAILDRTPPPGPTSLVIASGPNNPANVVNQSSAASVSLDSVWPGSLDGSETVEIDLVSSGGGMVTTAPFFAPSGGPATVSGVDLSGLGDGLVSLTARTTDLAGNTSITAGTTATKDVVPPPLPLLARVVMGMTNPDDFINAMSASSADASVQLDVGSDAADMVTLTLSEFFGNGNTSQVMAATAGAGTLSFTGLDVSMFADGMVLVSVEIEDVAQNLTLFTGISATLDTVAPAAPSSVVLPASMVNPAGYINATTATAVTVQTTLRGSYAGTESLTVMLDDGSTSVASGTLTAPMGGGPLDFTGIDASSLVDGPINVQVDFADAAGNTGTSSPMTIGIKDTILPDVMAATIPTEDDHPVNRISPSTQFGVTVEVLWGTSPDLSDSATVEFVDQSLNSVMTSAQGAPSVGGPDIFSGIDVGMLFDGPVSMFVVGQDPAGNETQINVAVIKLAGTRQETQSAFVANRADGTVSMYLVEPASGRLLPHGYVVAGTEPVAMAVEEQTRFVYVANYLSNDVSAFSVTLPGEVLLPAGIAPAGMRPVGIAVDPLARFCFVVNELSDDISLYTIDGMTGALTPNGTVAAGMTLSSCLVDPTGRFLYVASSGTNEVLAFAIDQMTGGITSVGNLMVGSGPSALAVAPSGRFLYVANQSSNDVSIGVIDGMTGALMAGGTTTAGSDPVDLVVSPDGLNLYVANATSGTVTAFTVNPTTGGLALLASTAVGMSPSGVAVDALGDHLVVTLALDHEALVFDLDAMGDLVSPGRSTTTQLMPSAVAYGYGSTGAGFESKYAFVSNGTSNDVDPVGLDSGGIPSNNGSNTVAGTNPVAVVLHPSGDFLYAVNQGSNDVTAYGVDRMTGALSAAPVGVVGTGPRDIAISPSGLFAYAINTGSDDITRLALDPMTGAPVPTGAAVATDMGPVAAAVSPDGRLLHVLCQTQQTVRTYLIDPATGALTSAGTVATGNVPTDIAAHPNGRFVYVVNESDGDVETFQVALATGALASLGTLFVGSGPLAIAIDPLGEYAYTVDPIDGSIQGYTVDVTTGSLMLAGPSVFAGLNPLDVLVDPSGQYVYVVDGSSPNGVLRMYDIGGSGTPISGVNLALNGTGSTAVAIFAEVVDVIIGM